MGKLELLKSQQDFECFKASKLFQTSLLRIRVHFSHNQNSPRFGFIIPKKVLPKANHRNLLKRRIKNALLKIYPRLEPIDVLFFPKSAMLKQKYSDLVKEIELIFTQARLWK